MREFKELTDDFWNAENEPQAKFVWNTFVLRIPDVRDMAIYVSVQTDGLLNVEDITWFDGKRFGDMEFNERREIYDYLCEWELAAWRRIGPEDSELFALKKLDPTYGIE